MPDDQEIPAPLEAARRQITGLIAWAKQIDDLLDSTETKLTLLTRRIEVLERQSIAYFSRHSSSRRV